MKGVLVAFSKLPKPGSPIMPKRLRCFCCGSEHSDYDEYKTHIFEDHADEENNLWVKCPHCDWPIRDIKSHFKIKHPHVEIPKVPQMRARIWKEWDSKKKKMKRVKSGKGQGKQNFNEGYFLSRKNGDNRFHYRSSWELYVMECLEDFEEVFSWASEPFPITYQLNGKQHMYLPDFVIHYKDKSIFMVEVKPKNQCGQEMNKAKWVAAKAYCDARRWKFEVWTEDHIVELRRKRRVLLENRRARLLNPGIDIL